MKTLKSLCLCAFVSLCLLILTCHSWAAGAEPAKTASAPVPARAKAVIQIWLWGGPSHLDTFDPKPDAGQDYCGPFNKTIQTNVPGIEINEFLPNLAKMADKYSIIRSMTHGINGHETAAYIMQTGHNQGESLVYPSVGAVVALLKGYDHGYKGQIPPYVILTTAQGRFSEIGFLGSKYKPLVTGGDPNQKRFAVEGITAEGISEQRQRDRRALLGTLDTLGKALPADPDFQLFDRGREKAYSVILGDTAKLFDLSNESDEMRNKYGRNKFGQSCLMARRLVENGVLYVTINYSGWDSHSRHFEAMRRKLPELDTAVAALLQDLSDKGLLDTTIVWLGGEFGRTPKVLWEEPWNGGRSHYGKCFSVLVAGGGFKGGHVVGASDAKGEEVKERSVSPQDLLGSIYELLGIDPAGPLPGPHGADVMILPPDKKGQGMGRLKEIM
ncbi:MAG: DUF1501 domain-containing protein [bacterium]|nr:DUF1501 domain-containing protein [bacterium]